MTSKQTITINGRHYDTLSGLPVDAPAIAQPHTSHRAKTPATTIHTPLQKSQTLNRRVVQKNAPVKKSAPVRIVGPKHMDIARSSSISRFAPHPVAKQPSIETAMITPAPHPMVQKARQASIAKTQPQEVIQQPSQIIKNEAIAQAMDAPVAKQAKQPLKRRFPRVFSIGSASLAVLLLAGYVTYLNMPTISIRVAAVQSGIDASYPDYHPSGYRLDGPIAYNGGEVSMRFAANAGPQSFSIKEERSTWNSSAVLENYIEPKAGEEYSTHTQSGLTIYTYDNHAAWVNGGILYTIEGNAPLSNDQILRIATSL